MGKRLTNSVMVNPLNTKNGKKFNKQCNEQAIAPMGKRYIRKI